MTKLCIAYLGVLLLAFHLTSQVVRAEGSTLMNTTMSNTAKTTATTVNATSKYNGSERTDAFTLLLPLALAASLLYGWSQ